MANRILLTTDSTCDMGAELLKRHDIHILPLHVVLEGRDYRDGVDITADGLLAAYEQRGVVPQSTAINIGEFHDFFTSLLSDGDTIVHVSISSAVSSSYANGVAAASQLNGRVFVVDSKSLSTGSALLLLKAAKWRDEGVDAATIAERLTALTAQLRASFIVDSLELLHKGGRCSALTLLGANLLKIKPCIELDPATGAMGVGKKYRGRFERVLADYCADKLSQGGYDPDCIFITHAGVDPAILTAVQAQVAALTGCTNVVTTRAGCTITTHCGRDTLGVLFLSNQT